MLAPASTQTMALVKVSLVAGTGSLGVWVWVGEPGGREGPVSKPARKAGRWLGWRVGAGQAGARCGSASRTVMNGVKIDERRREDVDAGRSRKDGCRTASLQLDVYNGACSWTVNGGWRLHI